MSRTLYLDCSSGISGDMTVAALLDLGADRQVLLDTLRTLPLDGYEVKISRVKKSAIDACDFDVILDEDNHDHDMAYLHGTAAANVSASGASVTDHGHTHSHNGGEHTHEHGHDDREHTHEHGHDDHEHTHEHGHDGHEHTYEHEHDHEHTYEHEHDHEHTHEHGVQEHLHEHRHGHTHSHDGHEHTHSHEHGVQEHLHTLSHDGHAHTPSHGAHDHVHRGLAEITEILRAGDLTPHALELALKIFHIVAEAEASVHGKSIEEVHFHEVGAVDSIVDIASVAICLDNLGVERVIIPKINEGQGQVRCQHGLLPIPVPAVTAIAIKHGLTLHMTEVQGELVTPTGAAIAAAIRTDTKMPEEFTIEKMGIGAGKRDYACAGILRAMLLKDDELGDGVHDHQHMPEDHGMPEHWQDHMHGDGVAQTHDHARHKNVGHAPGDVIVMETNMDDCTGETLGFVMNLLLEEGARDVYYMPIFMKKNRPAYLLSVICDEDDREALERIIFRHTTTIGIRYRRMSRTMLERQILEVETPWGVAKVKAAHYGEEVFLYPEHSSVEELTRKSGLSYDEMRHIVKALAKETL